MRKKILFLFCKNEFPKIKHDFQFDGGIMIFLLQQNNVRRALFKKKLGATIRRHIHVTFFLLHDRTG